MNKEEYKKFMNTGILIGTVANIEAASLDVRDSLKSLPEKANVEAELRQLSELAAIIAEKLEITEQVAAVNDLRESRLKADQDAVNKWKTTMKAFSEMLPSKDEEPHPNKDEDKSLN